ncbi:MAG TPA: hypothetical protein VML95_03835 [Longimicrobiales bacterium]|nr:hypothetical protein [Longimicrobiales bacterium]
MPAPDPRDVEGARRARSPKWTQDDVIRHPAFHGLREDKEPDGIVRERERTVPEPKKKRAPEEGPARGA